MHRIASLGLVVSGLLLGVLIIQRPWVDEASAAARKNNKITECIGFNVDKQAEPFSQAEVHLANVGTQSGQAADGQVTLRWYRDTGSVDSTRNFGLSKGQSTKEVNDNDGIARARIEANVGTILADARMNWNTSDNTHQTQVLCLQQNAS